MYTTQHKSTLRLRDIAAIASVFTFLIGVSVYSLPSVEQYVNDVLGITK